MFLELEKWSTVNLDIFANFGKKRIYLFLCFLFLRIHSNSSNKSITICVYYVQLFLNINYSYVGTSGNLFSLYPPQRS